MPVTVEPTEYGFRAVFVDPVTPEEHQDYDRRMREAVAGRETFAQLIDCRRMPRPLPDGEGRERVRAAMEFVLHHGLTRSAFIAHNARTALVIKHLAFGTSVYERERYFDGDSPTCDEEALDWLVRGIDPDEASDVSSAQLRSAVG